MGMSERLGGLIIELPVKGKSLVKEAELVAIGEDGYAITANKEVGLRVVGCALNLSDNSLGADGEKTVLVKRGAFLIGSDGKIRKTDIFKDCYVVDGKTVTTTADGSSKVGKILGVEADGVVVEIM